MKEPVFKALRNHTNKTTLTFAGQVVSKKRILGAFLPTWWSVRMTDTKAGRL